MLQPVIRSSIHIQIHFILISDTFHIYFRYISYWFHIDSISISYCVLDCTVRINIYSILCTDLVIIVFPWFRIDFISCTGLYYPNLYIFYIVYCVQISYLSFSLNDSLLISYPVLGCTVHIHINSILFTVYWFSYHNFPLISYWFHILYWVVLSKSIYILYILCTDLVIIVFPWMILYWFHIVYWAEVFKSIYILYCVLI